MKQNDDNNIPLITKALENSNHKKALKEDLAAIFGMVWTDDKLLLEQLTDEINDLIRYDFNKLLFIVYKVDVKEEKIHEIVKEKRVSTPGKEIALLLIERQLEKIEKRSRGSTSIDIPEDDKW